MNNRISNLLNTVRCLRRCGPVLAPKYSGATRKHASWVSGHKDPLENVNFRKSFPSIFPSPHGSSLRFLSQKADVFSAGDEIQPKSTEALGSEQVPQSSLELKNSKDDSGGSKVKPVVDHNEQFFSSLRKCTCPSDVLDLASESAVSLKHFTNCLTTTWRLLKTLSEDQQRYEKQLIFEHPVFVKLCQHLLRDARRMTRADLVFSLHAVVNLGVPQNTLLVQTLLRVCQVSMKTSLLNLGWSVRISFGRLPNIREIWVTSRV